MLEITEASRKITNRRGKVRIEFLGSDRKIEKEIIKLEKSNNRFDKIQAIEMRSILAGDTEESFRKACKMYEKTTKDHVRIVA